MRIVISDSLDPFWNLAAESYLLDEVVRLGPLLFLWRSGGAVVVGRHQNPWRECAVAALDDEEAIVARRISGGGTVYHDSGNLNYAYVVPREAYCRHRVADMLIRAMGTLGLHAASYGKNGLGIEGRKISGTAYCIRREGVLHHGTLLVHADLKRMHRLLAGATLAVDTHAVTSVPAQVVNLTDLSPGLDIATVAHCVEDAFVAGHGTGRERTTVDDLDPEPLDRLHREMASWTWRFGRTPKFSLSLDLPAPAGVCRLGICQGRVTSVEQAPDALGESLRGVAFRASALREAVLPCADAAWAATVLALADRIAD